MPDEPFIQRYLDGREALIRQEKSRCSDHGFRENITPMVAEASKIVSTIRLEEAQTLWNRAHDTNLARSDGVVVYPGMMFSLAKPQMESSQLWKIVKRMPKGALLHCHLDALGDHDWLIEESFRACFMHISAEGPLDTPQALQKTPFSFRPAARAADQPKMASIWSNAYKARSLIPMDQAAESFPNGGRPAFVTWLKSRVSITHEESVKHHLGTTEVWDKMRDCFPILASLHAYEPIFRKWIRRILAELFSDGVRWVDLRSVFMQPYFQSGAIEPDAGLENMFRHMQEEIKAFQSSEEGDGFWGARVIWTGLRSLPTRGIVEDMKQCISIKQIFPELIAGYDLVGQEELGRPHVDLLPELFWFKKRCMEEGVDIPFFFHAGETLGSGNEVDENLYDAILLGTRRIGHGFSLYKHPLLIDMVKDKRILIESCPVSNEVLRLTSSILSHPLPALLARGVACCLSNDDPNILGQGTSSMTHDFWQALQGWESLGLEGLAHMTENSVRYATFDDCNTKEWAREIKDGAFGTGIRARRMREWQKEFETFCAWVVEEFGPEIDLKTLD